MCFHTNILLCFREQCNYSSSVQDRQQMLGSGPMQDPCGELSPLPEHAWESRRCFEPSRSWCPNSRSHRTPVPSFEQRQHAGAGPAGHAQGPPGLQQRSRMPDHPSTPLQVKAACTAPGTRRRWASCTLQLCQGSSEFSDLQPTVLARTLAAWEGANGTLVGFDLRCCTPEPAPLVMSWDRRPSPTTSSATKQEIRLPYVGSKHNFYSWNSLWHCSH